MLSKLKGKVNKRFVSSAVVACTVVATVTNCFAEDTAPGALPADVTAKFTSLATGLVATIGAIAAIALLVYAAPQAIVFAKKIFKKVGS